MQQLLFFVIGLILSTNIESNDIDSISSVLKLQRQIVIENQLIGQIKKIHTLPDNRLVVFDRSVNTVYIIGQTGSILKTVTRTGSGPGEVRRIGDIAVSNNHIYLFDISNRKLVVYNLEGEFFDEIPHNTTAFHITGNDSIVYLFDTININVEKSLISRVKIKDHSIVEVPSAPSNFLQLMKIGTSGILKNITLNSSDLCFVHPYEGIPECINSKTGQIMRFSGSLEIFKTPEVSSFSNQLDPSAITHLSTGLFSHGNHLIHTIKDYDAEKDYIVVMNSSNASSGTIYIDDLGVMGVDSESGEFFTIEQSDDPDEDIVVINMYRMIQ